VGGDVMKPLLICLFLTCHFLTSSQPVTIYTKKDAIISASILGATFITSASLDNHINVAQMSALNFSGIAISAGYSLFKSTKISKKLAYKIKRRIKLNRNKSINPLICEK